MVAQPLHSAYKRRRQRGLPSLFSLLSWTILFDFRGCRCRTSPTRWLKTCSIAWCSLTRISWSRKVLPSTWLPWNIRVAAAGGRSVCRHASMLWKIWNMIRTSCARPCIREMKCVWPDVWPTAWYGIVTKAAIALKICGGCATPWNGGPGNRTLCVSAGVEPRVPGGQDALEKLDHQDPLFFKSGHREGMMVLDVALVNGHYMFIKNVVQYFIKHYFCNLCCKPFDSRMRHRCALLC